VRPNRQPFLQSQKNVSRAKFEVFTFLQMQGNFEEACQRHGLSLGTIWKLVQQDLSQLLKSGCNRL
jgi:hypothetical protein